MNILQNKLPSKVLIGGLEVSINTDFRTSIEFEGLIKQYDLDDDEEKKEFYDKALKLYYPILNSDFNKSDVETKKIMNHIAINVGEAIEQMMWFYRCGKELSVIETSDKPKEEVIDYEYDSDLIYSDFLTQYKIDFQQVDYMHWWQFKSLFRGLKSDSNIKEAISIRATDITKVPKEMRDHYKKLKKIYKIPLLTDETEQDDQITGILMKKGGDLSQLEKK